MLRISALILMTIAGGGMAGATNVAGLDSMPDRDCTFDCAYQPQMLPEPEVPQPGADELTGAPVFDLSEGHIGHVARLDYDPQGQILNATVDVNDATAGRKSVTLTAEHLTIMQGIETPGMQIFLDISKIDLLHLLRGE